MGNPEHECRQGHRCKARTRDTEGKTHGAGVERGGTLCRSCEAHAFAAIAELGSDYNCLIAERISSQRAAAGGPKVSGSSERPIPISLSADTLMTAIDDETMRWALRITKGDPLPVDQQQRVHRCVTILSANLGTLVDMPTRVVPAWFPYPDGGDWDGRMELDGVDAVLRLARLHDRARSVLGLIERSVEPLRDDYCHVCGLAALTIEIDTGIIRCRECRNCWSQEEFARLNNPLMAVA